MLKGDETIMITIERYNELLRKEFVYNFRREELKKKSWVSEDDEIMYELDRNEEECVEEDF